MTTISNKVGNKSSKLLRSGPDQSMDLAGFLISNNIEITQVLTDLLIANIKRLPEEVMIAMLEDRDMLMLTDRLGWRVAHGLAKDGTDKVRLRLMDNDMLMLPNAYEWKVVHALARYGGEDIQMRILLDGSLLEIKTPQGYSVADELKAHGTDRIKMRLKEIGYSSV